MRASDCRAEIQGQRSYCQEATGPVDRLASTIHSRICWSLILPSLRVALNASRMRYVGAAEDCAPTMAANKTAGTIEANVIEKEISMIDICLGLRVSQSVLAIFAYDSAIEVRNIQIAAIMSQTLLARSAASASAASAASLRLKPLGRSSEAALVIPLALSFRRVVLLNSLRIMVGDLPALLKRLDATQVSIFFKDIHQQGQL